MSQLENIIHPEFVGIYRVPPEKSKFQIFFSKNSEILVKYVRFWKFLFEKNGFSGKKKCSIFEKMDSFSNTLNRLKNETSLTSGGFSPPDPLRWGLLRTKILEPLVVANASTD